MPAATDAIARDDSLRRLRSFVSPLAGLVTETTTALVSPEDARLVSVVCRPADASVLCGNEATIEAGATKPTRAAALAAALGEAVERYAASLVDERRLAVATADELGPEAVDPDRFALFSDAQHASPDFPFQRFTRSTRTTWVRGSSLTGEPCWLPAELVYLVEPPRAGAPIAYATSSGLACGPTRAEATLSAFLELLERDAFMLTWSARLELPRIDVSGSDELTLFARERLDVSGARCEVIDLSAIHDVPTMLALARGTPRSSVALAVGAASAPSAVLAWTNAVCEAFAVRPWAHALCLRDPDRVFRDDYTDVVSFADHVHLHALAERASTTDFLAASPVSRPIEEIDDLEGATISEHIEAVVERLHRCGTSGYLVDLTPPDVAAAGLSVVRAVAPELCLLNAGHAGRFLGGRRLYEAPAALGFRKSPLAPEDVNPYPHPFP